jgi:molecular chaperone GrpE
MDMSNETDKVFAADESARPVNSDSTPTPVPRTEELVPAEWTPEQVQDWKEKAAKAEEYWDRLLRVSADFDNFRKRAARERQEAVRYANESLLEKLVPVLDSLEMALVAANQLQGTNADALKAGVALTSTQLRSVLAEVGLEEIDAPGKPFDPKWHEAVGQQDSTEVPEGHVLQQIRKGYKLKERLLRPATVIVARQPAA